MSMLCSFKKSSLNQFQIDGPNRPHFCFVYPLLGPAASLAKTQKPYERSLYKPLRGWPFYTVKGCVTEVRGTSKSDNSSLINQKTLNYQAYYCG